MQDLRTLIHLHTDYSFDSNISLERLASFSRENGIGCVAVTDHDTIEGAVRLRDMKPKGLQVIVGEEVSTRDGHLIGLFLERRIRPGMSARDTANAIREQGGLVFVPHPFVKAFGCGLGHVASEILDTVDAVEVCNGQNLFPNADRKAERFAQANGLIKYVGADSHMASSVAPCFQDMREFDGPSDFLAALSEARLTRGYHPLSYFFAAAYKTARFLSGTGLPASYGVNCSRPHRRPVTGRAVAQA